MTTKIDFVSDLHIGMWDPQYNIKHSCGERSNHPLDINNFKNSDSKILIVAGDTSDSLELSIKKLDEIGKYYDKILFLDGNREHIDKTPTMYEEYDIEKLATKANKKHSNKNNKLHFLSCSPFQIGDTIIIGKNGWWNYNNWDDKTIKKETKNYFKDWSNIKEEDSRKYCYNCMLQAKKDYNDLKKWVKQYQNDETVKKIVIVTHTVPLEIFANNFDMATEGNTEIVNLLKFSSKISHWVFGNSNKEYDYKYNGVRFISNPRGIPDDENREIYDVKSIEI